MELKRILAKDTRSANEKAMQLYGDDVLVISTQKVGDQTELIVAIDALESNVGNLPQPVSSPEKIKSLRQEKDEVFAEIFGFVQRQEMAQTGDAQEVKTQQLSDEIPEKFITPLPSVSMRAKTKNARLKAANHMVGEDDSVTMVEPVHALQAELGLHRESVEMLRQEVLVLRREMQLQRQVSPWQASQDLGTDAAYAAQELVDLGVPTGIRVLLVDAIRDAKTNKAVRQAMHDALKHHLSACVGKAPLQGIHALLGPSGSGKSHMVARWAYMAAKKYGPETQAIISFADARPGAWSQLQVLAASAGVEVYRASNAQALAVLLDELKPRLGVWIDTPANARYEIDASLCKNHPDIQWHAVAPLDASVTSLRRLQAQSPSWASVVITKADEGVSVWHWMQALSETPMIVSHVADSDQIKKPAAGLDPEAWCEQAMSDLKLSASKPKPKSTLKRKPVASRSSELKAAHG